MTEEQQGKVNVTAQVIVLLFALALLLWGTFQSNSTVDWIAGLLGLFLTVYALHKIFKSHKIQ